MKNSLYCKILAVGIIILFIVAVFIPSISSFSINIKQGCLSKGSAGFDPFNEGWKFRKKITIDKKITRHNPIEPINQNKVNEDLQDFPVLISIIDTNLSEKAQPDGDDILFMDDKGEAFRLPHEIEHYDNSSAELLAWVKIRSLSLSRNTILYMYYGNPSCDSQQDAYNVWDDDYCAVWHMNDVNDSTINKQHGRLQGWKTSWKTGKCNLGLEFLHAGTMYIPTSFDNSISREHSISCWVNWYGKAEFPSPSYIFDAFYYGGFLLFILEDGTIVFVQSPSWFESASTISKNIWTHIMVTYNLESEKLCLYINGKKDNSTSIFNDYSDTSRSVIGNIDWPYWPYFGQRSTLNRPLNGIVDEVRVSNRCKSSNWVSAEYNTLNDPSSFILIGEEEQKSRSRTWFRSIDMFPLLQKLLLLINQTLESKPNLFDNL